MPEVILALRKRRGWEPRLGKGSARDGMITSRKRMRSGNGDRIVRDQGISGGDPVFRGTRVTLRTVLASLAAGDSPEEILVDFPSLRPDDIKAAIAFAAASAEEDLPIPATPQFNEDQAR